MFYYYTTRPCGGAEGAYAAAMILGWIRLTAHAFSKFWVWSFALIG